MPVVMLLAVAAVLVSVFFVATGWGGELSYERPDHPPQDLGPVSATDVALMRPPTALWGYNMQVTDEALELIARAMRDRDVTIATLQQQLAELGLKEPQAHRPPEPRPALEAAEAAEAAESLPPPEVRLPPYLRQPSDVRPESGQRAEAPPTPAEPFSPFEDRGSPGDPPTVPSPQGAPPLSAPLPTDVTQPPARSAAPHDLPGPQGAYDAHGWWAEQMRAAREERAPDDPSCDINPSAPGHGSGPAASADDGQLAEAEEQGW